VRLVLVLLDQVRLYQRNKMANENTAVVRGRDLPISTKHSIEICNFIRKKTINTARKQLSLVLTKKLAIPAKRFNGDMGHRKGKIGPGFYPEKAAKEIIILLNSLESNINNKGLVSAGAYLEKATANRASRPMHHGRQRRRFMKRTHIEIVAREVASKKTAKKEIQKQPPLPKKASGEKSPVTSGKEEKPKAVAKEMPKEIKK